MKKVIISLILMVLLTSCYTTKRTAPADMKFEKALKTKPTKSLKIFYCNK
jgi:hypothetical protein